MNDRPLISVVIPVRNEAEALPSVLRDLLNQEMGDLSFEIVVADGGSTDGTRQVVLEKGNSSPIPIRLVDNVGVRSSSGRNVGILAAAGDVIVFLDGHCHIPSATLLADTLLLLNETGADCLCRPQPLLAPTSSATARAIAAVRGSPLGHGRDSLIYNMKLAGFVDPASSGATYLRKTLVKVGSYDESFDACEDVELNVRIRKAGLSAYTDPRLAVFYEARKTLKLLLLQMIRYGRGRIRLAVKHPDTLSVAVLFPMFIVLLAISLPLAVILPGAVRTTLIYAAFIYAGAVLGSSCYLALTTNRRCFWQGPFIYVVIHLGLGLGMLFELMTLRWLRRRRAPLSAA